MYDWKCIFTLGLLCVLAGCQFESNSNLEKQINDNRALIIKLQSEVASLKNELNALQQNQKEYYTDYLFRSFEKSALLTPGSNGYAPIKFDLGMLTVQLADVKPYANGSKIILRFGNMQFVNLHGISATVAWGKASENGTPNYANSKSKEVSFTEELTAGSWTSVSVIIEGLPPTELGYVVVRDIYSNQIRFHYNR